MVLSVSISELINEKKYTSFKEKDAPIVLEVEPLETENLSGVKEPALKYNTNPTIDTLVEKKVTEILTKYKLI